MINKIIAFLDKFFGWTAQNTPVDTPVDTPIITVSTPEIAPVEPVVTESTPKPTLIQMCAAIRDFEGGPGDASYRNNNPGNCRYNPSGYLPMYGNVRRSAAGFAIFPTYALGWLYLTNLAKYKIKKHPNWTILDFIGHPTDGWAPAADNNPVTEYAAFIARRLGVDTNYMVKNLV
jgi:hypothetical protein